MPIDLAVGRNIVQLIKELSDGPVLLEPNTYESLRQVYGRQRGARRFDPSEFYAELGASAGPGKRPSARKPAAIAVIPVQGLISQHPQSGGTSTDEIGFELSAALANPQVDAILLDVDSPGGTISGVPELGAMMLAAARGPKPLWAIANGLMASAAYWIGSAANHLVITPSGMAGSIGVYMVHEDLSQSLAQEGVVVTAISAGKYKTEGAPWLPLDAEAAAHMQQRVDEVYGWFVKAVADGRGDTQTNVRNGYGEGRVLGAQQALDAKLVDRVGTFDETIMRLGAKVQRAQAARQAGSGNGGSSASILRRRLELGETF